MLRLRAYPSQRLLSQASERAFTTSLPYQFTPCTPRQDSQPQPISSSPRPDGRLLNKKAIITGASRGIGKAIALRFAEEGASCVLIGRNARAIESVKEELGGEGRRHRVMVGDVGDKVFWDGLKREKNVDILVNAAGVTHYSPFVVTSQDHIEKVLQTNLLGTMLACRMLGKGMMGNHSGCIINVASLLGLKGGRGSAAYAASKAGVIGFTRALAAELGEKDVRVNVIIPGYIETDMTAAMTPEARSAALNAIPLKYFGQASDIADALYFWPQINTQTIVSSISMVA